MISLNEKQDEKNNNAIIVFTREPEAGKTKTRLMPYFSADQCAELHRCMIKDINNEIRKSDADIIVSYTCDCGDPVFLQRQIGGRKLFMRQHGEDIGSRMKNALGDVLGLGYQKVVLIGTDIPEIEAETIDKAFVMLDSCDVVMGSTEDGGYYLIGMKSVHAEAFNVRSYGVSTVFDETVASLKNSGLTVNTVDIYADMDTRDDIAGFRRRMRTNEQLRSSHTGKFLAEKARISVIVPVYNESAEIKRMLMQLLHYRNECEIIIVDGESTDDTAGLIYEIAGNTLRIVEDQDQRSSDADDSRNKESDENSIYYLKTKKGKALQMNAGARISTGDILLFLHCDSVLPDGFTDEIRKVMVKNDWGCFKVRFPSKNFFMLTNRIISNHRARHRKLPFGDQGIFIDRNLFFEMGMFPEIPLMEDYEFSRRMRLRSGITGPGSADKYLTTSARRYGSGTKNILRTEMLMWKLRYMYRRGTCAEKLKSMYDDIR